MGETNLYQPLTRKDKISVVIYRAGIVMSSVIVSVITYILFNLSQNNIAISMKFNTVLGLLYFSVGLSVFFIHLYVGSFHRALKKLYYVSIVALIMLLIIGNGDALRIIINRPYGPLLLLPLSGCLGFITAKEAFCFKLIEGYILALLMPIYLFMLSARILTFNGVLYGLLLIAIMLAFFTVRKVFMPLHYDIGDKSAYS